MSQVTRWWWIRHAPVQSDGRVYGQRDLPADLDAAGGINALAKALPSDAVWLVTQLSRTQQTAAALRAAAPAETRSQAPDPRIEVDLIEQNFGAWQGLTYEELDRQRDGAWHRFWLTPASERPPDGESFEELMARVATAIERLTAAHAGADIVAVAHGGTIRAALALALGLHPERALAFTIEPCSLTRLDHIAGAASHLTTESDGPGVWRVVEVNRQAHREK